MTSGYGSKLLNYRLWLESNTYEQVVYGRANDIIHSFNRGNGALAPIDGSYSTSEVFFLTSDRNFIYFGTAAVDTNHQLNKLSILGGVPQKLSTPYPNVSTILGEYNGTVYWHQSVYDAYKLYGTVINTGVSSTWNVPVDSIIFIDSLFFSRDNSTNVLVSNTNDPSARSVTGVIGYVYKIGKKGGYYYVQTSDGIYRLDSTGKNALTLFTGISLSMQLSTNYIFYLSSDRKNVYRMNYDGTGKTLMHTFPDSIQEFTASMDGNKLYFNHPTEQAFYVVSFNTAPTITLTSPTNNQVLSEGGTLALSGSASDSDAGNALYLKYSIDGGPTQTVNIGTSDGTNSLSFSKTLTFKGGQFFDGSTAVSNPLTTLNPVVSIWVEDSQGGVSATQPRTLTIDQTGGQVTVPVNVVSSAYLVSQMGRPVRLSNGWMVGTSIDNTSYRVYFYVSKDNGKTWIQLCYIYTNFATNATVSIASKGNNVYVTYGASNLANIRVGKFDASIVTNTDISGSLLNLDASQTAVGTVTSAITPDGTNLWWAASTKNSTYPNSYNIRAGSIPINADGTLGAPGAVSQLIVQNTTGRDATNPSILAKNNGFILVTEWIDSVNWGVRYISSIDNGATNSGAQPLYQINNSAYAPKYPNIITTPSGKHHVTWHATDSTDITNAYIRYSNSSDGVTWPTTPKKLVKGQNAMITSDKNGKLTIHYEDGGYIKRIESTDEFATWTSPVTIGAGTKPASLYDPTFQTDFTIPPTIYQAASAVKYYGAVTVNTNAAPTISVTTANNQTLYEGDSFIISGSAADANTDDALIVKYKIDDEPEKTILATISTGAAVPFTKTLTFSSGRLKDGSTDVTGELNKDTAHTLTIWAQDGKGATSAPVTRQFTVVPNRPPAITIDQATPQTGKINVDSITVSGSVNDPDPGNTTSMQVKINSGPLQPVAVTDGRWSFSIALSQLSEGANVLEFQATDSKGTVSTKRLQVTKAPVATPLKKATARYKILPPQGTAKKIVSWINREKGDLSLDSALSIVASGQPETFAAMTKESADITMSVAEDEFTAEVATAAADVTLKMTGTKAAGTSPEAITKVAGVIFQ